MTALVSGAAGLVVTSCARAENHKHQQIIEHGVLKQIKSEGLLDAPNTVAGISNNVIVAQLVENASRVSACDAELSLRHPGKNSSANPREPVITAHFRCIHPELTNHCVRSHARGG